MTRHSHPTVKLWAETLLKGESISYAGDPLLDFGLANFLDRISYKNPKSAEKLAKLKGKSRMADSEQPINTHDFTRNNMSLKREEEKYMYKYFTEKPKKTRRDDEDESDMDFDGEEDPEMEKFADQIMKKEMKKMN